MAIYLGIDYGLERTGLAISEEGENLVFPLATMRLADYGGRKALLDAICARAVENNAQKLVIGLPLFANGGESLRSRQVRNVAARIHRRLPLPLYLMPELLSSVEARADLREAGLKKTRIRQVLDQWAACRILESFLREPEPRRSGYEIPD